MTSSNKTYRNSRTHTSLAAILATVSLGAVIYLGIQVNGLSQKYGMIASDIDYYQSQREGLLGEHGQLLNDIAQATSENSNLRAQKIQITAELEGLNSDIRAAREDLDRLLPRIPEAQKTLDQASSAAVTLGEFQQQEREVQNNIVSLQQDKALLEDAIANLTSNHTALGDQIVVLRRERDELQQSNAQLETDKSALLNEFNRLQRNVDSLLLRAEELRSVETNISEANDSLAETQRALTIAINDLETTKRDLEANQTAVLAQEKALDDVQQKIADVTTEFQNLSDQRDMLKADVAFLADELLKRDGLDEEIADLNGTVDGLNQQKQQLLSDRAALIIELESVNGQISTQQQSLDDLRTRIANYQERVALVEEQLARIDIISHEVARVEEVLSVKRAEQASLDQTLRDLQADVSEARQFIIQRDNARAQIQALEDRKNQINAEITVLEATRDALTPIVDELRQNSAKFASEVEVYRMQLDAISNAASQMPNQ